jgi:translation initiation factor 3 subunit F
MDSLFLEGDLNAVNLNPVVLFSVLDHYMRRVEGQKRVIGTLMGTVVDGVVRVEYCFPVPHLEKDGEVAVGKDFNKDMLALQQKCLEELVVVGWYATATDDAYINEQSCLIQEFYEGECAAPVLLVVDTSLHGNSIGVKAFNSTPLKLGGATLENTFEELKLTTTAVDAEALAVDTMLRGQLPGSGAEAEAEGWTGSGAAGGGDGLAHLEGKVDALERSMGRLLDMLERASGYVSQVVGGTATPDNAIARQIADTLAAVPRVRAEAFEKMFSNSLQDLLMVVYLSNLTRTQLAITDHLSLQMAQAAIEV